MIWHIYDHFNSDKSMNEMIIRQEHPHLYYQQRYTSSLSSTEDSTMQTLDGEAEDDDDDNSIKQETTANKKNKKQQQQHQSTANQSLFLNFTSDLCLHQPNSNKKKKAETNNFKVNGVNILNRKNLDSKTAIARIQKRKENHNHVERKRRDCINNSILQLSHIVPNASLPGQKLNKSNVLKLAFDYILIQFAI